MPRAFSCRGRMVLVAMVGLPVWLGWMVGEVGAQVYSDRGEFLAASGAAAEPAWPNAGLRSGGATARFGLGRVTLSIAAPSSSFYVGSGNDPRVGPDWTTLVAGNDIAISGPENLNVDFDRPMNAFGFDFAEPTTVTVVYNPCSAQCPCANSTFRLTLLMAGVPVATFDFSRPDDVAAFVGVRSVASFDRAEIRELNGTCDDEYFGRMYTRAACAADFNGDGFLDFFDYDDYVNCFETGTCTGGGTADFNGDGFVDFFDYDSFVEAFEAGC